MDENQGPHPSSNFVLRRLNTIRGARNVLALSYAADKTAQKSRELIEFKKDRLEVSAITAKTLRELCSRICSVAGAIRSLWLILTLMPENPERLNFCRHHHCCRRCLDCYTRPIRFVQPFSDVLWNFLNNKPRNRALAPSAPQACFIVITYIATFRNTACKASENCTRKLLRTRINTGQNTSYAHRRRRTCKLISTVFHRPGLLAASRRSAILTILSSHVFNSLQGPYANLLPPKPPFR
jgi:hypothetical protein